MENEEYLRYNGIFYNGTYDLNNNASDQHNVPVNPQHTAFFVFALIIYSIEIPFICLAIYTIFSLTKSGEGAPVFVINLLITDLIQIISSFFVFGSDAPHYIAVFIFALAFYVSLFFMMSIAVERYLLIAHPIWYRTRHPRKCLVCTSLIGWFLQFIIFLFSQFFFEYLFIIVVFIYYIVIIFCFAGACRALYHTQSITAIKKQLVLATLFFVLLNYTLIILPFFIVELLFIQNVNTARTVIYVALFVIVNPLTDCVLYVFMRTDIGNAFSMCPCYFRRRRIQSETGLTSLTGMQREHA